MARSIAQIKTAIDRYDASQNEGGEGYNPHRYELAAAQAAADKAAEAAAALAWTAQQAAEAAEWTPEVTQARRGQWNSWVRQQGGPIGPRQLAAALDTLGFGPQQLKKHLARHGLA